MFSKSLRWLFVLVAAIVVASQLFSAPHVRAALTTHTAMDPAIAEQARVMLDEGRRVFRFETFGDEAYWGETLKLHRAIAGAKLGGVGPGVSPKTALSVGLKVDVDAVPAAVAAALKAGQVNLDDPASTIVLLKAHAVVGVTGHFDAQGTLTSLGVQCGFCHSNVDDSFAPASAIARTDGPIAI
jgi:hypothetical protein